MTTRMLMFGLASLVVCGTIRADYVYDISTADGPFAPSFRGEAGSTYFAWARGSWNADETGATRVFRENPSVNPAGLADATLIRSDASVAAYPNIVSSSGNLYTSPSAIDMTLTIPTDGVEGTGFTTIIIQGRSLDGFGGALDVFSFGEIAGVAPVYVRDGNADGATQWWAKWEIAGNLSTYDVLVNSVGIANQIGLLSLSEMVVDTYWSTSGYAPDTVIGATAAVPEPSSVVMTALGVLGVAGMMRRRRRA